MGLLIFHWEPPRLSEAAALALGGGISRLGENHYLWQFRKVLGLGPLHPPSAFVLDSESAPPRRELRGFFPIMGAITLPYELMVAAAFLLFCIGAVLYVGDVSVFPYVLGAWVLFCGTYFGSLLWAFGKYRRWLGQLQQNFSEHR